MSHCVAYLFVDLFDSAQLLLQLHSPVLEPDLDLSFREAECMCNLDASSPGQVVVEVKLLLQLQRLESRICLATASTWASVGACRRGERGRLITEYVIHIHTFLMGQRGFFCRQLEVIK